MAADELSECVQDFYHNLSERLQTQFKGTADVQNPQADSNYHVSVIPFASFRLFGTSGGRYGWSRKVHDESPLQGSVLPWDHRRWEERPGYSEENQASTQRSIENPITPETNPSEGCHVALVPENFTGSP